MKHQILHLFEKERFASDSVEVYKVEEDGEMIAFPNGKVKVGQRSGLVMKEVSIDDLFKKNLL